jgi:ethanolamine utilization protein EutN
MRLAIIKGHVTSTVKHPSFDGWRLLIAQPVDSRGAEDGPPQVVIDNLGAAIGQKVMISSDGAESRRMVGDEKSPARWNVLGIIDPHRTEENS